MLSGGRGADLFVFANAEGGDDIILDFELGIDKLSLDRGLAIMDLTEQDTDSVDGIDSTLISLSDGSSVLLFSVIDIADPADLF